MIAAFHVHEDDVIQRQALIGPPGRSDEKAVLAAGTHVSRGAARQAACDQRPGRADDRLPERGSAMFVLHDRNPNPLRAFTHGRHLSRAVRAGQAAQSIGAVRQGQKNQAVAGRKVDEGAG